MLVLKCLFSSTHFLTFRILLSVPAFFVLIVIVVRMLLDDCSSTRDVSQLKHTRRKQKDIPDLGKKMEQGVHVFDIYILLSNFCLFENSPELTTSNEKVLKCEEKRKSTLKMLKFRIKN